MHILLDYLNKRNYKINTVEGAEQCLTELLQDVNRLNHSLAVTSLVEQYLNVREQNMDEGLKTKIIASALLHDIGYSNVCFLSNFHPYDGHLYLRTNEWDNLIHKVCLYHSFAPTLMELVSPELKSEYERYKLSEDEQFAIDLVTCADMQVNGYGKYVTINARISDIKERHGEGSKIYKHIIQHENDICKLEERFKLSDLINTIPPILISEHHRNDQYRKCADLLRNSDDIKFLISELNKLNDHEIYLLCSEFNSHPRKNSPKSTKITVLVNDITIAKKHIKNKEIGGD